MFKITATVIGGVIGAAISGAFDLFKFMRPAKIVVDKTQAEIKIDEADVKLKHTENDISISKQALE